MADNPSPLLFSHKEVVEALIKRADLHEGLWQLSIEFAFAAGNSGPDDASLSPTAIVAISKVGLTPAEKPSSLTADAAEVNPLTKP